MKRLVTNVVIFSIVAFLSTNAQGRPTRTRPDAHTKPSGGIVEKPYHGKYFKVVNAQKSVADDSIRKFLLKMKMETLLPFESRVGDSVTVEAARTMAERIVKENRVGAGIVIVDDATRNMYIESTEGRWAVLNISPLKTDAPNAKKLEMRCAKMLWRATARALGVGYTAREASVLKPFSTLEELDSNPEMKPAPDGSNALLQNAAGYGITPLTIASYRTACRNGWAPAPTNDIQKAIWNEIHAMPTAPIKIKPETKKVRE